MGAEVDIDALDARCFDLLLTDLRMPGICGLAVARHALARPPRVIVTSGFATPEQEEEIDQLGAALLRKPFELEVVEAAIRSALGE